jgi:hypothetical protein
MKYVVFVLFNLILSSNIIFIILLHFLAKYTFYFENTVLEVVLVIIWLYIMPLLCLITKILLFKFLLVDKYIFVKNMIEKLKNSFVFNLLFLSFVLFIDTIFGAIWVLLFNNIGPPNTEHISLWLYFMYFAGGIFPCYIYGMIINKSKSF